MTKRFIRDDGTIFTALITEGQGTSAYYPASVLERDVGLFEGAHCYIDHPTTTEQRTRPERSVRDLAGIVHNPRFIQNGPEGTGSYGDVEVLEHWKPFIEQVAPHTGMSIRASGLAKQATIDGKTLIAAEKFTRVRSVDFVTKAGRGGKLLQESERDGEPDVQVAAREVVDRYLKERGLTEETVNAADFIEAMRGSTEGTQEDDMDLQEAQGKIRALEDRTKEMQETIDKAETGTKTLTEENQRLSEALCVRDATDAVRTALLEEKDLPDVTKNRILATLPKAAPLKEGKLDEKEFSTQIKETIEEETKYLHEATGRTSSAGITGMGASEAADDNTAAVKRLHDGALKRYLAEGYNKETAEQMATTFSEAGR